MTPAHVAAGFTVYAALVGILTGIQELAIRKTRTQRKDHHDQP